LSVVIFSHRVFVPYDFALRLALWIFAAPADDLSQSRLRRSWSSRSSNASLATGSRC